MKRIAAIGVMVSMCLCISSAYGITVDGAIAPGEYPDPPIIDPPDPGADYYNTGLDIDSVYLASEAASYYLGLTVASPPFDLNGADNSFIGMTSVVSYFFENGDDVTPNVMVMLSFNDTGFLDGLSMINEWDEAGGTWVGTSFLTLSEGAGGDYEVATAEALEIRLSHDVFSVYDEDNFPSFLRLQLDNTGWDQDDQIAPAAIPVPVTLVLVSAGIGGLLLRRRK
jgi:hypothetical protein